MCTRTVHLSDISPNSAVVQRELTSKRCHGMLFRSVRYEWYLHAGRCPAMRVLFVRCMHADYDAWNGMLA